jgi:hypothetical protein
LHSQPSCRKNSPVTAMETNNIHNTQQSTPNARFTSGRRNSRDTLLRSASASRTAMALWN